jgi:hypothetical protein
MDLQTVLNNAVAAARAKRLKTSPQLTLGELILKLEAVEDKTSEVRIDFGYFRPVGLSSWRGSYSELAIEYSDGPDRTVQWFIDELKAAIGKTYEGYKGGDFTMGKNTPIWVDNYGDTSNTGVVDVLDKRYIVVIETRYCEY